MAAIYHYSDCKSTTIVRIVTAVTVKTTVGAALRGRPRRVFGRWGGHRGPPLQLG